MHFRFFGTAKKKKKRKENYFDSVLHDILWRQPAGWCTIFLTLWRSYTDVAMLGEYICKYSLS